VPVAKKAKTTPATSPTKKSKKEEPYCHMCLIPDTVIPVLHLIPDMNGGFNYAGEA